MNKQRLKELYRQLPSIDCKGKCWGSCGVAPTGDVEQENIADEYSEKCIPTPCSDLICNQLDRDTHKCTIHDERPLICRLFGLVNNELMKCPHGCEPEYWVPERFARRLMNVIINGDEDDLTDESIRQSNSKFRQAIEGAKNG